MLRIDVNSGDPYSIPAGNPFPASNMCGAEACPEIWAWGLRNPWRWSFDKSTGKLWAGDVGKEKWEAINIVEAGKNYGWRCYEGLHENNTTACLSADKYTAPVAEYPHTQGNLSVTGGYVYWGASVPGLQGTYLYADFGSGQIWGVPARLNTTPKPLLSSGLSIASFVQDNQGELYVIDYFPEGRVYKIIPESQDNTEVFPRKLSETGCFDSADITQPAKGLIPYNVNTRLWSDGLGGNRWMALPDGETITIDSDGNNWVFPIGSVLVKEFRFGEKRVETRLLMRHGDGAWAGYSYEWNEEQTNAILLDGAKSKSVNSQVWDFPSRTQCMRCHTKAADFVLGPETVGLNGLFTYSESGETANQIATLDHIGLFTSPLLPGGPDAMDTVVNYSDPSQTSEARARSYLHANCSHCHQPDATGLADFRYQVSFKEMGVCDALPTHNNL
jgi:cytochrome c553